MQAPDWPSTAKVPLDPGVEEWSGLVSEIETVLARELRSLGKEPALHLDENAEVMTEGAWTDWLSHLINHGFNTAHPGFLAFIPGGGLVTSALADWFVKTSNRYGTAYFASPLLAELEYRVIQTFAAWVGYGEQSAGVLTTGGSLANFTAVVTARRAMLPEDFLDGVLYCSDQTHHSVMKAANLAGFSKRNIRVLPSDENFRLVPEALAERITQDRQQGMTPFMVIASAGTTNTGSIDPLVAMADICQNEGLWYHVDGAYGGAFVITEEGKEKLTGMERANSITLDPHKGLFLPYGTGCILVKDKETLFAAHEMRGDYMPDLDRERAHLDPFSLSVELSREHRGLKVALPFLLHGVQAFVDELDEKLALTKYLYQELEAHGDVELLNDPDLTTIAFRVKGASEEQNRQVMDSINERGKVYLSGTILNDQFALRISILSHRTHREEIDSAISELRAAIATIG